MSNDWDAIFSGAPSVPTGAKAAPAAKPAAVAAPVVPFPGVPVAPTTDEVADDLFALLDEGSDNEDDSQQPAALAAAKSTLAAIMQEQPAAAPAAAPVPAPPAPAPVEAAKPGRKPRGANKKTPVTGDAFAAAMGQVEGGSKAAETTFPAPVASNELPAATESKEATERENAAIEASVRFLASVLIRRLQS